MGANLEQGGAHLVGIPFEDRGQAVYAAQDFAIIDRAESQKEPLRHAGLQREPAHRNGLYLPIRGSARDGFGAMPL